jgi:hypothetical protein
MNELILVESVIGIFLLLHIVRPYVNVFRMASGFVFFPPIALFCCIAMIPAYGIRPECFPLFLFASVYTILNFSSVSALFSHLRNYSIHNSNPFFSFMTAALLLFSLAAAFRFAPRDEMPDLGAQKTQFTVSDSVRGVDLFASYYKSYGNDLVMVSPPIAAPLSMIEDLCIAFKERGYNVLAFSRPHFDCVAVDKNGNVIELPALEKIKRYAQAMGGIINEDTVRQQRQAAAEREADIRFLLSALKKDALLFGTDYEHIFLFGYGAGGAASVGLSGDKHFLRTNPAIKAVAVIESVALCDFAKQEREPEENTLRNIGGLFRRLFQKPLPHLENIPHPEIPVLFVAGDGARGKNSYNRYMAVVQTMLESETPFFFASINGVHAIDFSSLPRKYPVMSLFFRGKKEGVWPREEVTAKTADYIAAFFSLVKENASATDLSDSLERPGAVFLETLRLKSRLK